jgi:tetratricopeptide (TPR) repeat protein
MNTLFFLIFSAILFVNLTACSPMMQDGALVRARNKFLEGDYVNAIAYADNAIAKYHYNDNTRASLLFMKAESYQQLNEYEKAIGIYTYLTQKYPDTEYASMSQAILAGKFGQ